MWLELMQITLAVLIAAPCAGLVIHVTSKRNQLLP
jgi:hypothetical protein